MVYRNLLVTAGGGIISQRDQAEQEECANIFIGLGGTGISCLREVKAQVYRRLKRDDPKSDVPEYKHIQFLAIDTDETSLGDDGTLNTLDKSTEFKNIGTTNIKALIGDPRILRQNPALQWFTENISIQNAEAGAGGVRQIGRLLTIQNVNDIVVRVSNKINLAREGLDEKSIYIHIFTGMGGGTGAGSFLDFCYILKHIISDELGLYGRVQTSGYFFLPDVNLDRVETETVKRYIQINGFAAMKELDYCMNFHYNHGEWNQNYGSFTVKTDEQPVDLAYLITAKDEQGNLIPNGYNYAMNVVAEYVMEFMTKQLVSEENRKNGDFGLKSHISNFRNTVKMVNKRRGVCYDYCVLGSSNAFLPFKDINSYLAAKVFEEFSKLPRENYDVEEFLNKRNFSYEAILEKITKTDHSIPLPEIDAKMLKEQCAGIQTKETGIEFPALLNMQRDAKNNIVKDAKKNAENLCARLMDDLLEELIKLCTDMTKGPYYASLVLKANKRDAVDFASVIKGYLRLVESTLNDANNDLTIKKNAVDSALMDIQHHRAKPKYAQRYVLAVQLYFKNRALINQLEELQDTLEKIERQITSYYDDNFAPLIEMFNNVEETFRKNLEALSNQTQEDRDYAIKIIDLKDENLIELLDTSLEDIPSTKIIEGFIEYMLKPEHKKIWQNRSNETRLANIISNYFAEALKTYSNKNIDDYLATKYKLAPNELVNKVFSDIMLKLSSKAKPLFWARQCNDTIATNESKIGYVSIPDTSDVIASAADKLHANDKKIAVRRSIMPDRISVLTFYCGVPMYMSQGVYSYKPKYIEKPLVGMHLYEGTTLDSRNFKILSNIDPFNIVKEKEPSHGTESFETNYKKAIKENIIEKVATGNDSYEYYLRIVDEESVNEIVERINKTIAENNLERKKRLLETIEENTSLKYTSSILLPIIGSNGFEDMSVQDEVFGSLYLSRLMEDQLSVLNRKLEAVQKLKDSIGIVLTWETDMRDFSSAICTGAIFIADSYTVKYLKDEDGFSDEYDLTTIDQTPYGELLPIYSAFVEFRKLDDEDRRYINELTKKRKVGEVETCKEHTYKAKEYVGKRISVIKDIADESFRTERRDIYKFIDALNKQINNYERTFI